MLFSSIPFLYYFLPCVLLIYGLSPGKWKNFVLLCASFFFYFWGEPKYVILMSVSILLGYFHGLLIERFSGRGAAKIFLISSLFFSLGMLAYFKYADFFLSSFNAVFHQSIPLLKVALPIGISFYTFQMISYLLDVYWGRVPAQKNLLDLAAYIALFPQLIAGPIVRYADIQSELQNRRHSLSMISEGCLRFAAGLGKKVLIANQMGAFVEIFRDSQEKSVVFCWLYAIAYTLQIYFDFSGYSDMAIGLGRIFGFHFLENFNYPYVSKSVTEFWRRWHISLGSWFRDYLYIPMGGNRCSKPRWLFNILTVWALTGLWHGASWNFVLWGLFFGILLMVEKLWLLPLLQKIPAVFSHLYVMFLVVISFVIFNGVSLSQISGDLKGMFGGGLPLFSTETGYYFKSYGLLFLVGILGSLPVLPFFKAKLSASPVGEKALSILQPVCCLALLAVSTAFLVDGSFNPFLYFRF